LPDTRQSGSRRVSKSITRTLDFEESDTLDGLLNGNFCHKSMRGKLQRGSVWAKRPTSLILHILEASRSSPSIFLGPSAPLQRKECFIPSSVAPSILAHHAALRSGPRTVVKSTSVLVCSEPLVGPCSCLKKQNSCVKNR